MTKNLFGDLNLTFVPNGKYSFCCNLIVKSAYYDYTLDGRIVRFDHPDGTFKFVQVDHDGWPNPAKLSKFVVTGGVVIIHFMKQTTTIDVLQLYTPLHRLM